MYNRYDLGWCALCRRLMVTPFSVHQMVLPWLAHCRSCALLWCACDTRGSHQPPPQCAACLVLTALQVTVAWKVAQVLSQEWYIPRLLHLQGLLLKYDWG